MNRVLEKYSLPLVLCLGDLLAMLLFVAIGQREHALTNAAALLWGLVSSTSVFAFPWIVVGAWLRIFPRRDSPDLPRLWVRSLNAWLVAAPLAILLRAYVLGRAVVPTVFITATLVFGGLFLLGWRAVFGLVWRVRAGPGRP